MIERLKNPCNACEKQHCIGHTRCEPWVDWFSEEWSIIRYSRTKMEEAGRDEE